MMLTFSDGGVRTLDLQDKWSTTIVKELMDVAGCSSWQKWKEEASELGLPVVPGEEREGRKVAKKTAENFYVEETVVHQVGITFGSDCRCEPGGRPDKPFLTA
jgi:hypothetical protein